MSIERAVESTIKPFLYLIRKPRNNQKQSGNSIVGHPVVFNKADMFGHGVHGLIRLIHSHHLHQG